MRLIAVFALILVAAAVQACSVPVFAYALRNWEPEDHLVRSAQGAAWLAAAGRTLEAQRASADVADATAAAPGVYGPTGGAPWLPGELDEARLAGLADSPARRELVRRLVDGDAAVWLFLRSGDAAADSVQLGRLRARLDHLTRIIALPELDPGDDPLAPLRFSILEIDPADPAEWATVAQLRALAERADAALATPVYGRARALLCLPVVEWTDELIDDATLFLTGACSCQVKQQNPGSDLLVCGDWRDLLTAPRAAPVAVSAPKPPPPPVERVVIGAAPPPAIAPPVQPAPRSRLVGGILLGSAALLAIVLIMRRQRRPT